MTTENEARGLASTDFEQVRASLMRWAEDAGLGPLLRDIPIPNGRVLRWRVVSITLRSNTRPKPAPSYMDQEFEPLPYTVDRDGNRIYPNGE
jgi:hypothetical protein